MKRLVFASLFLISGSIIASAQIKLSFNPEKGKKYECQQKIIQNTVSTVMGQDFPMETEMNITYLMEIKDKTPQEAHVQFTYGEVAYIISSPVMKMGYDSKNPVENPSGMDNMLDKMLSQLMNQSIMAVILPDGSAKSVTGMDAVAESMNSPSVGDPMADQMLGQLKQQFNDAALENSFNQIFRIYPSNQVKAGDRWNLESAMEVNNMSISVNTRYTLKEVSKNKATITEESAIELKTSVNIVGNLSGTQSGVLLVDTQTGMPVSSEKTQNIKGVLNAHGFDVQTDINTKAKVSIKEVK